MPASNVVGLSTPPMVKFIVTLPASDRMVTVCLPSFSVRRYTAFR